MSCEPRPDVDENFACNCLPQTAVAYQLVNATVTKFDTEIVVQGTAPCCGFGLWKPCPTGEAEIFRIVNAVYNAEADTTTLTIVRGLAFNGNDFLGDSDLAFAHSNSQELIIGDVGIHYYYAALCERIADLEVVAADCCMTDDAAVQAIAFPTAGQRCVAWNDGAPIMWVYQCDGETGGWKAVWNNARTRLALSATDPIAYDNVTGNISLQYNTHHFHLVDGDLTLDYPTYTETLRSGVDVGLITLNSGNDGLYIAASAVTIGVADPSLTDMAELVHIEWQIDPSAFVTGSNFSAMFAWDIYRSDNGGAFNLVGTDYHQRQLTNQGYGDATVAYGNNDMQTIPFFDVLTDCTVTHTYKLRYRYIASYGGNIAFSQVSYDLMRQFIVKTL